MTLTPWTDGPLDGVTAEDAARLHAAATEILWANSGRRFNIAAASVEWPAWCRSRCERGDRCRLALVERPVVAVDSVEVDGVEVDEALWRYVAPGWVEWVDGSCPAGAVRIEYRWGEAVPEAGLLAAAELVDELALAFRGEGRCRLPRRVQSITRQGVTVAFVDPQDYLDDGRVGLPLCDLWLASVNPDKLRSPAVIASPDWPSGVRA